MSSTKTKRAGYNVFVQEKRKEVVAELEAEGTKNKRGDVGRRLGEKWRELAEDEQAEWHE